MVAFSSEGFYVGYKVILAIDALTFEVLGFEIFEGSPMMPNSWRNLLINSLFPEK